MAKQQKKKNMKIDKSNSAKAATGDEKTATGYLLRMSQAPALDQEYHWFQTGIIILFTAVVSMILRMAIYQRPVEQFYWTDASNTLTDFFSYWKMTFIIIAAVLAVLVLLYRLMTQTLVVRRTAVYVPMAVYALFVVWSYARSDYQEFALIGFMDRFEGLVVLLCYMVMLFYIINTLRTEKSVKWVVGGVAVVSALLGILGLFQSLGWDLFKTKLGMLLLIPGSHAAMRESMVFNFDGNQIYQTLYNINYVSFYLTLLLPLFGMLFIRETDRLKKIGLGALFALLVYNLIGSESSGGVLGVAVCGLVALIVLNKQLVRWWKSIAVLLVITLAVTGLTLERIMPEMSAAIDGVLNQAEEDSAMQARPHLDYLETGADAITISIEGNPLEIQVTEAFDGSSAAGLIVSDDRNQELALKQRETDVDDGYVEYEIDDPRFINHATLSTEAQGEMSYVFINMPQFQWTFVSIPDTGIFYVNNIGKLVTLQQAPHSGFAANPNFGSGRGYIWSRTAPMVKDTLLTGYGPENFVIHFPNYDYAGKYSAGWNPNTIVDKPHNMYLGAMVNTGGVSLLALLALYGMYLWQSVKLYTGREYGEDFLSYCGAGIFFGICGFLVAGLVNDSTVNVTAMFYGLLGTGLAVNAMIATRQCP